MHLNLIPPACCAALLSCTSLSYAEGGIDPRETIEGGAIEIRSVAASPGSDLPIQVRSETRADSTWIHVTASELIASQWPEAQLRLTTEYGGRPVKHTSTGHLREFTVAVPTGTAWMYLLEWSAPTRDDIRVRYHLPLAAFLEGDTLWPDLRSDIAHLTAEVTAAEPEERRNVLARRPTVALVEYGDRPLGLVVHFVDGSVLELPPKMPAVHN